MTTTGEVRGPVVESTRYGPVPLKITAHADDAVLHLRATGRFDAETAPTLSKLLSCLAGMARSKVVVDLRGAHVVDDEGMAELARCREEVERDGRRFAVLLPRVVAPA